MKALREKDDINIVDGQSRSKPVDTLETKKMKDEITTMKRKLMGKKELVLFLCLFCHYIKF